LAGEHISFKNALIPVSTPTNSSQSDTLPQSHPILVKQTD